MEGNWNVNSHRNKFETDEQWEMRKKFMEAYKHNFSEDQVVCLAQVLVNMEFLGTRYSVETTRTVNELSQDIIGEFRDRQKTRLQRTFVGGTDAANAKVKGTRPVSTLESECEKKTVESNARYFLSAIVSSSSKSVTKEEAVLKQERNKLNPSPEASTMMVEHDSKSELPSRKRKNKKEAFAVEKICSDNDNSSKCTAPCQSEEMIEPTRKKKKLKNKMKETHLEKTSTDNLAVSKCTPPRQSEEMIEPSRKKKKLKNKINGNLVENATTDHETVSKYTSPCPSEKIIEPSRKKKKLKNKINETHVEKTSTDNETVSKCTAPCPSEEIIEPTRKKKKLKNIINETHLEKTFSDNDAVSKCTAPFQSEEIIGPNRKKKKLKNKIHENLVEKTFIDNDADSVSRERDIAYCMAHCREVLQFPAQKIACTALRQSEETIKPTPIKKAYKNYRDEFAHSKPSNFIIIMLENAINYREIIENSARYSDVQLQVGTTFLDDLGCWQSELFLDNRRITSALHENQKESSKPLYKLAFDILEKTHYRIVITDSKCVSVKHFLSQEEDDRLTRVGNKLTTTIANNEEEQKEKDVKKGNTSSQPVKATAAMKMMKMMGWTEGTGLGLHKQGIVEPVNADVVVGRSGIGYDGNSTGNSKSFVELIRRYLRNYKKSDSVHNLVFSNEFSSDQRKHIHLTARKMGLLSASIGKEPNRQLTVRRSPFNPRPLNELLNQLIESKGSDPLFSRIILIPPCNGMEHCRVSLQFPAQQIGCTAPCQSEENLIDEETYPEEEHLLKGPPTEIRKTLKVEFEKNLIKEETYSEGPFTQERKTLKVEIVYEIAQPQPSNLVIIMHEKDTNYRQILLNSARYSDVQLRGKKTFLEDQGIRLQRESEFFLDNIRCASIQYSQRKRSANVIYQLLFGILEKTHYKIIITDKMCNSVDKFMSQEEEDQLKKINYITVVNDNKYVSMEYFVSQAEEYREEEEKRVEKKKKKFEEKKRKFEEKRGYIIITDPEPVKAMVAMKMMKMMGWAEGTGLGLQNQGIVEPVKAEKTDDRRGLGYGTTATVRQKGKKKDEEKRDFNLRSGPQIVEPTTVKRKFLIGSFLKMIHRYLLDYVNSGSVHNIVFSNEFNIGQRKMIHNIAYKMGLNSVSSGEGRERQITVSRVQCKRRPLIELLNQLLESKGSDPLFSRIHLIPPTG